MELHRRASTLKRSADDIHHTRLRPSSVVEHGHDRVEAAPIVVGDLVPEGGGVSAEGQSYRSDAHQSQTHSCPRPHGSGSRC